MELGNILNTKGNAAAVAAEQQLQHFVEAARSNGHTGVTSDTGSERGLSPHQSSKYSSNSDQPLHNITNMANAPRFTNPQSFHPQLNMIPRSMPGPHGQMTYDYDNSQEQMQQQIVYNNGITSQVAELGTQSKAFACSSCGKGFARRSDLARHERIHSGVRPHVCDHPGCGKQFIQRSALTVHARVHTGEKPHMCEHCTKPFSDSSSLARHRRIHSGKRPYKCPYADCQKTFTRRTTLTRHQNHHTGTVEEAAATTAATLASRPAGHVQRLRSDGGAYSDTGSTRTSPSPGERTMSMSPSNDIRQVPLLPRQTNEFPFMNTGSLPPHMRGDMQHHSPRSSPGSTSPSLSNFGGNHHQQRQTLTSHPIMPVMPGMYGPPPTLEPPTHHEQRQPGSGNGSPHLSTMGWQSPSQNGMGSPGGGDPYMYPEPPFGGHVQHLYYQNSNIRRPQSTEPNEYETKPRLVAGEVWPTHM